MVLQQSVKNEILNNMWIKGYWKVNKLYTSLARYDNTDSVSFRSATLHFPLQKQKKRKCLCLEISFCKVKGNKSVNQVHSLKSSITVYLIISTNIQTSGELCRIGPKAILLKFLFPQWLCRCWQETNKVLMQRVFLLAFF